MLSLGAIEVRFVQVFVGEILVGPVLLGGEVLVRGPATPHACHDQHASKEAVKHGSPHMGDRDQSYSLSPARVSRGGADPEVVNRKCAVMFFHDNRCLQCLTAARLDPIVVVDRRGVLIELSQSMMKALWPAA